MEYRVGVNEGQGAGNEATGVGRWHRNGLILYDHRLRAVRDDADDISTGIESRAVVVRFGRRCTDGCHAKAGDADEYSEQSPHMSSRVPWAQFHVDVDAAT